MPPPQACAKCRNCPAAEGDSWCLGCTGWEAVGRELTAAWDSSGARRLASDLVVSCCRQVRALRSVTAGLSREVAQPSGAGLRPARGSSRPAPEQERRERSRPRVPEPDIPPRSRARSGVPEPPDPPRARERVRSDERIEPKREEHSGPEEEEQEESEEEEEEERRRRRTPEKSPHHRPVKDDRPRSPPEGDLGQGLKPLGVKLSRGGESRHRDRSRDRRRDREGRSTKGGHRRGGRKHKKLYRLAENPFLRVHRAPGRSFWDLSVENPGSLEVTHLGR